MWDADTKWTEGVNEYGISMIGSASGASEDMKKDEKGKDITDSPDGKKMRTALFEKTPEKALRSLIDNKVCGNTIVFSKNTCLILESTNKQEGGYKYKTRQVPKDEVMVRTNHGIMIPSMGYQSGKDRVSSEKRYEKTKEKLVYSTNVKEVLESISTIDKKNPQHGPRRPPNPSDKNEMWTTGQIMCVPSEKTLHYRAIQSDVEFSIDKLNDKSHKTKFEIISSKNLLSHNVISFGDFIK
tara:strand:- start:1370 stop:2089 length:720 start_codon:yes stop_codon:yes gene_type:complete